MGYAAQPLVDLTRVLSPCCYFRLFLHLTAIMPSISWTSPTDPQPQSAWDALILNLKTRVENTPSSVLAPSAFALGSVSTVVATILYARYFRRFPNGDWVTPDVFARKQWVKGVVTRQVYE